MVDKELYHHGVKGMKWGVRRTDAQLGHKTTSSGNSTKKKVISGGKKASAIASKTLSSLKDKIEAGKKARAEAKAKKESKEAAEAQRKAEEAARKFDTKKPVWKMSDAELNARINRLKLEEEYKDRLNKTRNEKAKKGKDFVGRIMERSGEELLTQVTKHYGAKALNKAIGEEVIYANNKKKS